MIFLVCAIVFVILGNIFLILTSKWIKEADEILAKTQEEAFRKQMDHEND
jgi:hypothetical protein